MATNKYNLIPNIPLFRTLIILIALDHWHATDMIRFIIYVIIIFWWLFKMVIWFYDGDFPVTEED